MGSDEKRDAFWQYVDDTWGNYEESIYENEGDLYQRTAKVINSHLGKGSSVLDIGNGGVINYEYKKLGRLVCADLEVTKRVIDKYKDDNNVEFIIADITSMSGIPDGVFDAVIVQNVIHHLAETKYQKTVGNLYIAINECSRVLKPGGRIIILESTFKSWAYTMERAFYWLMMIILRAVHFDQVFQYSQKALKMELSKHKELEVVEDGSVEVGKYTIFIGKKLPSKILPLSFSYYILEKK